MKKLGVLAVVFLTACAVRSAHDTSYISDSLRTRTGHELRPGPAPGAPDLPAGVSLKDGLTVDEAVAVGLWKNPQFQADVGALGFARADLIEAGLLRNPVLSFLFPLGPKQLEATLNLPLEFFLQRPRRVAAAKLDVERVAENLVQHGLNLTRDILVSHADLVLALPTAEIAVMGPEAAVNLLHRKALNSSDDPDTQRAQLIAEYRKQFANPYVAAARGYLDAVIAPRETRLRLITSLQMLRGKRASLPIKKHSNIPL